jgi:hypothetical protein
MADGGWRMADGGEQIAKYLCTRRRGMKEGKKTLRLVSVVSSDRLCKNLHVDQRRRILVAFQPGANENTVDRTLRAEPPESPERCRRKPEDHIAESRSPDTGQSPTHPNAMKPLAYEKATCYKERTRSTIPAGGTHSTGVRSFIGGQSMSDLQSF